MLIYIYITTCHFKVLLAFMVGMTNLYTYYGYYDGKSLGDNKGGDFKAIKSFEGYVDLASLNIDIFFYRNM